MHSMTQDTELIVGGVDAHADAHHAAALDQRGGLLATKSFPTTTLGYRQLLDWLSGFGEVDVVAVESTGSYAAALVRYLREHDIAVVEVNQTHAHTRRRVGKSDPIDAEMAARLFQAGKAKVVPKQTDGIVQSIRLLRVARDSAVKSRSAALVQIRDLLITAPEELRDQLSDRKTLRGKAAVCARFRPSGQDLRSPSQAAKFALRSAAQRIEALDREIAALDRELEPLVAAAAPRTIGLLGISTGHAGQLLVTAGQNIDRLRGEGSFAMLCGASPIPASSGKTLATASTTAATGKPTAGYTSSLSVACATATARAPTSNAAPPKARPNAKSCAASSAASPARSTTLCAPTSQTICWRRPRSRPPSCAALPASGSHANVLDIYRNVPSNRR